MPNDKIITVMGMGSVIALTVLIGSNVFGCASTDDRSMANKSNAELLSMFEDNAYADDIVAAEAGEHAKSKDSLISPAALASIESAFSDTYRADFERCFEIQMDRLELERLSGDFAMEVAIAPTGKVTATRLLEAKAPGDNPEHHDILHGEHAVAEHFHTCVNTKSQDWEFSPAPEIAYTHTYALKLGEAW